MKNVFCFTLAAVLFAGAAFAQDSTANKKVVKMTTKEMKHDAKMAKKEAKLEGNYMKVDSAKEAKHDAKMMKKTAKKMSN